MSRKSDNFPLVLTGGTVGLWLLLHKIFDIFFEDWIKHQLEPRVGHTVAEMIERFGSAGLPALAAGGIVWFLLRYVRAQYEAERHDPAVEAQREHTAALLAQTAALQSPRSSADDPIKSIPNLRVADSPAASALFQHPEQDKTIPMLESGYLTAWARKMGPGTPPLIKLEGSIWRSHHLQYFPKGTRGQNQTFIKTNVRDDSAYYDLFLNLEQAQKEWPTLRMSIVPGNSPDLWKPAPEAVEAFADKALLATRDSWAEKFEEAMLKGLAAEDELRELQKNLPGLAPIGRVEQARNKLSHYAMRSDDAEKESQRAWDLLRDDIRSKLMGGVLTAKAFESLISAEALKSKSHHRSGAY
jgi:hypothetical protein